jgi:HK97 family phage major capsid protein
MTNIINLNEKSGRQVSRSQVFSFLEKSSAGDKYGAFSGIDNISEYSLRVKAKEILGDLPEGTFLYGAKGNESILGADSFETKNMQRIHDAYYKRKKAAEETTSKALTSSSVSVLVPTIVEPGVVDVIAKKTPFYAMIPKKIMTSKTMTLSRRASDLVDSIDFSAESANDLTAQDQTYTNITVTAKLLFVAGTLTHFAQAATQETVDLFAQEVQDHFIDLIGFKEKAAIRAEITADGVWNGHFTAANGYDGIVKRIADSASSNLQTLSSQSINLSHIDQLIEDIHVNNGEASAIFCDPSTFTRIRSMARDHKRYDVNDTNFGYPNRSFSFDGIPVMSTNFMSRTANSKAAFAFDITGIEYRVLVPDTFYQVSQDQSPTYKFFFEVFEAFVVVKPEQCAAVINGA